DTGIFEEGRYFDVFVEYAKGSIEDLAIAITVFNRGPETAVLELLPTVWFRNTWSWKANRPRPSAVAAERRGGRRVIELEEAYVGRRYLHVEAGAELLFTENETNAERIFGAPNPSPYVKDAFHRYLIDRDESAVNPARRGTKAAARYRLEVPPGGSI